MRTGTRDRRSRGAILVEAAITLPLFLFVMMFSIEFTRVTLARLSTQYAVYRAVRWSILGQTTGTMNRIDSIKARVMAEGVRFGVAIPLTAIRVCPAMSAPCATESAAGPGDYINVSTDYSLMSLTGRMIGYNGPPTFRVLGISVGRNEYYG